MYFTKNVTKVWYYSLLRKNILYYFDLNLPDDFFE